MNRETIKSVLAVIPTGDFLEKSKNLLAALGYHSERTLALSSTVAEFLEEFPTLRPNTQTELAFRNNAQAVHLLCQFTNADIAGDMPAADFLRGGWVEIH